jgi:hypothetical protein
LSLSRRCAPSFRPRYLFEVNLERLREMSYVQASQSWDYSQRYCCGWPCLYRTLARSLNPPLRRAGMSKLKVSMYFDVRIQMCFNYDLGVLRCCRSTSVLAANSGSHHLFLDAPATQNTSTPTPPFLIKPCKLHISRYFGGFIGYGKYPRGLFCAPLFAMG